jgi:6-phosphogluconolactonase
MEKNKTMQLKIYKSVDEVIQTMADHFVEKVNATIAERGECNVVLSGGKSPKQLYDLLSSGEYRTKIDWDKIYFFFADERCVPFDDEANNGLMAKRTLFEPLKIADSRIFYISTLQNPEEAAKKYARRIVMHFKDKPIRFDVVLLGLGDDAHTASLFPGTPVLREQKALVGSVAIGDGKPSRITMTAPLINESYSIFFLVFGESKAKAVQAVLEGERNEQLYPAQLIHPEDGTVDWFLDEKASAMLTRV